MKVYKIVFAKQIDNHSQFVEKNNITETNFSVSLKNLFFNYADSIAKYDYKVVMFYVSNKQLEKIFNLIAVDNILQPDNEDYLHLSNSFKKHGKSVKLKELVKEIIPSSNKEIYDDLPY